MGPQQRLATLTVPLRAIELHISSFSVEWQLLCSSCVAISRQHRRHGACDAARCAFLQDAYLFRPATAWTKRKDRAFVATAATPVTVRGLVGSLQYARIVNIHLWQCSTTETALLRPG